MKTLTFLFFLFMLTQSNAQVIDSLHRKKAEQIIERVASGLPLPYGPGLRGGQSLELSKDFFHLALCFRESP